MKKNFYEHTFIVNAVTDEEEIKATVNKHVDFIKENGADIDEIEEWGIKRLAYVIDGKRSGYYVNMYFHAPADLIVKFERLLQIDDNVMRYLTIKYDNKMLRHRELRKKGTLPDIFPVVEEAETESED